MHPLPLVLGAVQAATAMRQQAERVDRYNQALQRSQELGLPLLVVGAPAYSSPFRAHPCGDVTLDIREAVLYQCPEGGIISDVRDIPFPDGYFGAIFCSHVLEHLPTRDDILRAWSEMNRISNGNVFIAGPSRLGLWNWVMSEHSMFVTQKGTGELEIGSPISPLERLGAVGLAISAFLLAH